LEDVDNTATGKLEKVRLRDIWKSERHFTRWLEENIEILNDRLDLSISAVEREKHAGTFAIDFLVEGNDGRAVIIENQGRVGPAGPHRDKSCVGQART
jgi:hypothetical protein